MSNWINIDKQQPTEEEEYLCVCEDGCYWLGMWQPYDKEFAMLGTKHNQGSIAVEYWQELPSQPSDNVIENDNDEAAELYELEQRQKVAALNEGKE